MRFTVIYRHSMRENIFPQLLSLLKKVDLSKDRIQSNIFTTSPAWPAQDELNKLDLQVQVEELILENEQLLSIRKLIIDIETELMKVEEIVNV